jgi:hypothetical protein
MYPEEHLEEDATNLDPALALTTSMRTSTSAMRICWRIARHRLSHYVPSSAPPVAPSLISRRHPQQSTRSRITPTPALSRPRSKLQHFAWHNAVNARILHTHTRNLCRRLLDCALGPGHSLARAHNICLGSRSCHKSCKGLWVVVSTLLRTSPACCVSCIPRDGSGQLGWFCGLYRA